MPNLTPVDHDPFALTPVDHDPFASVASSFGFGDIGEAQTIEPKASTDAFKAGPDMAMSLAQNYTPLGLVPPLAGGVMGGGATLTNALGLTKVDPLDVSADVQNRLTYEPKTKAGQTFNDVARAPWQALSKGANLAGNVAEKPDVVNAFNLMTGNHLSSDDLGTATRILGQAAPLLVGAKFGADHALTPDASLYKATADASPTAPDPVTTAAKTTQNTLATDVKDTATAIAQPQGEPNGQPGQGATPTPPLQPPGSGNGTGMGAVPVSPEEAARVEALKAKPDASAPLPPATPVDATTSVPLAGGVAEEPHGPNILLDKRVPKEVTIPDKQGNPVTIDVHDAIGLHERTEHPLMKENGMEYGPAHDIATKAENAYVEHKYNVDPEKYQQAIKDHVAGVKDDAVAEGDIHPNIDTQPYTDEGDEHLLKPISETDKPNSVSEPTKTGNPITDAFADKLKDHEAASKEYAAHKDTDNGTIINTDIARELSPDYVKDRTKSADVHEPASAFTKQYYADKLAEPTPAGKDNTVLFTGGGTGAGKSTGLAMAKEAGANPELIYDTNMNKMDSASSKIDQALQAGRNVDLLYTHRDPVEAFRNGALKRATRMEGEMGSGRTVPLQEHINTHVGANDTIRKLTEKYKNDPRVKISVIDNSRGAGKAAFIPLDKLPKVEENGLKEKLTNELDQAHANGEISDAIHAGFGGKTAEGPPGGRSDVPGEVRPGIQPESTGSKPGQGQDRVTPEQNPEGVSVANEATNADRTRRGVEELVSHEGPDRKKLFSDAVERLKNDPGNGQRVAADIVNTRRGVKQEDVADLLADRVRISNEYDDVNTRYKAAKTDTEKADSYARLTQLDDQLKLNELASRIAGTEASWALSARQMLAAKDYSLVNQKRLLNMAEGGKTTPPEFMKKFEEAVEKANRLQAENESLHAQLEGGKGPKKTTEQRVRESTQSKIAKLKDQIATRLKACPV